MAVLTVAGMKVGRLTKDVTDGSCTLTDEEASSSIIEFTGTPSGAVTVTLPSIPDGFVWACVRNNSGQTVTFKAPGGTGITIADGKAKPAYCGASDVCASYVA